MLGRNQGFLTCTGQYLAPLLAFVVGLTSLVFTQAHADLRLCNHSAARIGIAIGYQDAAKNWTTEGWWNLPPHACERVVKGALKARFYYVHAVDYDKGGEWAGDTYLCTRDREFNIKGNEDCQARGYDRSGFFKIDATRVSERRLQRPKDAPCICTAQYDPVCGRAPNGREATYSNSCRAGCEGAAVIRKGAC